MNNENIFGSHKETSGIILPFEAILESVSDETLIEAIDSMTSRKIVDFDKTFKLIEGEKNRRAEKYRAIARDLCFSGEYDEAKEIFIKITKLIPNSQKSWTDLGDVLLATRDFDDSEEAYRKALEINNSDSKHHSDLAFSLEQIGDSDGGKEEYEEAVRLDENNSTAQLALDLISKKL